MKAKLSTIVRFIYALLDKSQRNMAGQQNSSPSKVTRTLEKIFRCQWKFRWSYFRPSSKSESFSLENDGANFCIGVQYIHASFKCLIYFVHKCHQQSGLDINEVCYAVGPASERMPMQTISKEGSSTVFICEVDCRKRENVWIECTFWIAVMETVDGYGYQLMDKNFTSHLWSSASNQVLTDLTFRLGKQIFPGHRALVAARSPLLAEFSSNNNPAGSDNSQVEMSNTDASAFKDFLIFLYTGQLKHVASDRNKLLLIADKYDTETLTNFCSIPPIDMKVSDLMSTLRLLQKYHSLNCSTLIQTADETVPSSSDSDVQTNTGKASPINSKTTLQTNLFGDLTTSASNSAFRQTSITPLGTLADTLTGNENIRITTKNRYRWSRCQIGGKGRTNYRAKSNWSCCENRGRYTFIPIFVFFPSISHR